MFDFKKTYQLPFKIYIPNYIQAHIEEVSQLKRFFKFFLSDTEIKAFLIFII